MKKHQSGIFQKGYDDFSESWKVSQTPESWMSRSCVWYSKIIGLQLGLETIQSYLTLLEYGNRDVSGGLAEPGKMSPAWISSSLKISPRGQVGFIQKMINGKTSFQSHAVEMTRKLLFKGELSEGWSLYGKTGLGTIVGQDGNSLEVRWFVGWIENDHFFFPFAYQMREKEVDVMQTVPRVKQLLEESKVMKFSEEERVHTELTEQEMQRESISKPEIKLIGICVRTNNEQESDKMKEKIFPCIQKYFHGALFEKIPNRKKPGTTFCAYTDYESDYTGDYTYFVGEEVSSFDRPLPEGFQKLVIPSQQCM